MTGKLASPSASGFFALRTPLLPFATLVASGDGLAAPAAYASGDRAALERALAADRARLRPALRALLDRPDVREALFVASPSLHARLPTWLDDPDGERGLDVERALVRYVKRMAARATPFGLFAGSSVGDAGPRTCLALPPRAEWRRHTRLDMHYLTALTEVLGRTPALRAALRLRPSSSLYRAAGRIRYVEARSHPSTRARSYHLISVAVTDYLEATLARAAEGATLAELAGPLVDDDISVAEAEEYIADLLDAQILVPECEPAVTGPDAGAELAAQLRGVEAAAPGVADRLDEARSALAAIDAGGLGAAPERYLAIAEGLRGLPAEVEVQRLFQVDLVKPTSGATLGPRVMDEVSRAIALHRRIGVAQPPDSALERFCDAFVERWGGRQMPLVEVLDDESGIGFGAADEVLAEGSPLLEELDFPAQRGAARSPASRGERAEGALWRLFEAATARGAHEIALAEEDLAALEGKEPLALPGSFAVMATLIAPSADAADRGDLQLLFRGVMGPSGASLLGRFCHGDPDLRGRVEAHLRAEEALAPDAIFAEVVHLPQGRMGNVICRPVLRAYEIPYLGRSGASPERRIPITDLLVSVRGRGPGAKVVLHSARLGREVVPRITSAFNSQVADAGVYRFLCALQAQGGQRGVAWDWGPVAGASFLPRVTAGRIVLSLARWRLDAGELDALHRARGADRFAEAQALRARRRLPRFVSLIEADNALPIDLDNALSVEAFAQIVKGSSAPAALVELFPGAEGLPVEDEAGARFVHELIVPFVQAGAPRASAPPPARVPASFLRSFPPGSDWLYARLYTGVATADAVLREVVRPVVDAAIATGAADAWFFLRYGDPGWHLRLRLHGPPARLLGEVLPGLENALRPLRGAGAGLTRVDRVALDTYEREVERYGGPEGVELAEQIFFADSEAALGIVETLDGDAGSDARWRLALASVDRLLDDLGLSPGDKLHLTRMARDGFAREVNADAPFMRRLDARYRRERPRLEDLLARTEAELELLGPGLALLDARSERLRPLGSRLRALGSAGALSASVVEIAASYAHMTVNRLLRSAARAQELVIHDFLCRLHESAAARASRRRR